MTPSYPRNNKCAAVHRPITSKKHPTHQANAKTPRLKWVRKAETPSCHKPHPWHSAKQSGFSLRSQGYEPPPSGSLLRLTSEEQALETISPES